MKVIVASTNPVKIKATKSAFKKVFPDKKFEVIGVETDSGVPAQPIGIKVTALGAKNRALFASKKYKADYFVGIEGGVNKKMNIETPCMVIIDKKGNLATSKTGSFMLPKKIQRMLKEGKELGDAGDILFKSKNNKQTVGVVGLLTGNVIDRTLYYEHALILALIPFRNKSLYFDK